MPESKICPNPRSLILPMGQKNNWEDCARRLEALPMQELRAAIAGAKESAAAQRDDEWLENLAEFETLGSRIWDPA